MQPFYAIRKKAEERRGRTNVRTYVRMYVDVHSVTDKTTQEYDFFDKDIYFRVFVKLIQERRKAYAQVFLDGCPLLKSNLEKAH